MCVELIIHDFWKNTIVGCLMYILQHKLKKLKIELIRWNKNSFGNVQKEMFLKQNTTQVIKTLISHENTVKEELDHALHCQYLFLKEKALV